MINWTKAFQECSQTSWPTVSLCIQNRNPNHTIEGSRNIYKDEELEILKAAKENGFKMLGNKTDAVITFLKDV